MSKRKLTGNPQWNWSQGLLASMKDPDLVVRKTKDLVVIKDKYPKAKIHYLILPHADINGIHQLNDSHLPLLELFEEVLNEIKKDHPDTYFRVGFHAIPSMQRLHLHVISNDMISSCLKTKTHWNSFTTSFFVPLQDVKHKLRSRGCLERLSPEEHKSLMNTPLKCNQCSFTPKTMPQLKEHLLTHENKPN